MGILADLGSGFLVAGTPVNLVFILLGVTLGQILGALPGIGPSAGMALLLPFTFGLEPTTAIVMLAGIMYGGMYGGTLTSVLVNVPGEAASVMTAVEGHQLARQGRAGAALSIAAIGSFLAGVAAVAALVFVTPLLAQFALRFNAPEYFLLAALGIIATASIGTSSAVKALLGAMLGLIVALVGIDPILGTSRLTFGEVRLLEGIDFLPVAIGVFGIAEVLVSLEGRFEAVAPIRTRLRDLWITAADWAECRVAILRGGLIGFLVGLMPGTGPTVAAMMAYATERRFSRRPEMFGRGALDGLAASEAANNSAAHGALVPMLALGIPGSASTAVLLAAFILQGIRPGPLLMVEQADLFWGLIASMFIGNLFLLVMNLPLAPVFAALLRIRYEYLAPAILVISLVGAYATSLSLFPVVLTLSFGIIGYLMLKVDLPRAPMVLALVLAALMESWLRQNLLLAQGSPLIFIEPPLAAVLTAAVLGALLLPLFGLLVRRRRERALRGAAD